MEPNDRSKVCVVVADAHRARFFVLQPGAAAGESPVLVEDEGLSLGAEPPDSRRSDRDAGPRHPYGAQRERHRVELQRRFSRQVADRVAERARECEAGLLILVAEPRMLGLLREPLQRVLADGVRLKELARDYTSMAPAELQRQLQAGNVL